MQKRIKSFVKNEIVLVISALLAAVSMAAVPPDRHYAGYIHWSTLSTLMCLMLVMTGLRELGIFRYFGRQLLKKRSHARSVVLVLVSLCFLFSPFITNDVALITFVPFTIFVLEYAGLRKYMIPVLSLQTIAAHKGSMISPVGNPHNIYLFGLMNEHNGTGAVEFIFMMLPYFVLAGILLVIFTFLFTIENESIIQRPYSKEIKFSGKDTSLIMMYAALFVVSLLPVFGFFRYYYALASVLAAILVFDRKTVKQTDYSLLFTFMFLFILVGNLGRIQALDDALTSIVSGNELMVSVAASQIISNAPASILLSGFTDEYFLLALGTDLGGLGTLIASMANLISFKKYTEVKNSSPLRYILGFTLINLLFLVPMLIAAGLLTS